MSIIIFAVAFLNLQVIFKATRNLIEGLSCIDQAEGMGRIAINALGIVWFCVNLWLCAKALRA